MVRAAVHLVTLVLLAGVLVPPGPVAAQPVGVIPGQYIVELRPGVDPATKANEAAQLHAANVLHIYEFALNGFAATIPDARLARLQADPDVLAVVPDREVYAFDDPPTGVARIRAPRNPDYQKGAVGVPVAVLDTGIDVDHPDLNVAGGKNCQRGGSYDDGHGHGTHVAGTIGAKEGNGGVVGVAPGTPLYAVRVLDNRGSGSWSSVICGIDWVTQNAGMIPVANMSLGGSGSDDGNCGNSNNDSLHKAICASVGAGVTYVVAAGNDNADAAGFVPAAYNEVITVSALADSNGLPCGGGPNTSHGADDWFATFSNYGADVDIAAPGVDIYSTTMGGGYGTKSGTSMASPHVAGAAALAIAGGHAGGPAGVRAWLVSQWRTGPISGDDDGATNPEGVLDVKWESASDAPVVAIAAPSDGATVSGTSVAVSFTAYDKTTGCRLKRSVTATLLDQAGAPTGTPVSLTVSYIATKEIFEGVWDTSQLTDGTYRIEAKATDGNNNTGTATVDVVVENGTTAEPTATSTAVPTTTTEPTATNTPVLTATETPTPTSTNTLEPTATDTVFPTSTATATQMVPAAPSDLTATAAPRGKPTVSLSWTDNATTETGFILYRCPAGQTGDLASCAATTLPAKEGTGPVSVDDRTVSRGTTYTYVVVAVNEAGASNRSNEVTITA